MRIFLKQPDIEQAIKTHLENSGVTVKERKIEMAFTAKRKNGGVHVDVSILEMPIPDFSSTEDDEEEHAVAEAPSPVPQRLKIIPASFAASEAFAELEEPLEAPEPAIAQDSPKTLSLFS